MTGWQEHQGKVTPPVSVDGLPLHLLEFSFPHPDPHTGLNIIACFLSLSQHTLRRMCYLTIKEMSSIAEDVIIVTSRQVQGLWMAVLMGSIDTEAIFSHVYQTMRLLLDILPSVLSFSVSLILQLLLPTPWQPPECAVSLLIFWPQLGHKPFFPLSPLSQLSQTATLTTTLVSIKREHEKNRHRECKRYTNRPPY